MRHRRCEAVNAHRTKYQAVKNAVTFVPHSGTKVQLVKNYSRAPVSSIIDEISHFATVSYAFCKRFSEKLSSEIFEHILNKALNKRMVDPSVIFIDGIHVKASANKKKFQKQKVTQTARVYTELLRQEVNQVL